MARFFKFKTLDELQQTSQAQGLDLEFHEDLRPLFEPVQVGPVRVGNRLCIQPLEGCDGTLDGEPGELTLRRFERFGAGGAKLIWGEATAVVPEGRANPRQLVLNDRTAAALERVLHACRQAHRAALGCDDLLLGLQLTHSGRYSHPRALPAWHDPLLDPLTVADRRTGQRLDASSPILSDDDLERLEEHYVRAALLAWRIGCHFIDLKQCHGYLLNELLAARGRPGRYGGSLPNRTRFAGNVLRRIAEEVPGLLLATRISVYDGVPVRAKDAPHAWETARTRGWFGWGVDASDPQEADLTEPLAWIAEMRRLGVVLVNVTLGNPYVSPHLLRPFEYPPPDGYEPPEHPLAGVARHFRLTAAVQRAFPDLAVVGSGYSYLQEFWPLAGAANVRGGRTTFVGVGRAALAQPDFARRLWQDGRLDRRRICRTFSYCTALMRAKHNDLGQFASGCPPFDKEVYGPIWAQARQQPPASPG
jgi:NADPH2 dehydrogenase